MVTKMIIYFKEKDGEERYNGYSEKDKFPERKSVETSESELNTLIPDSFEGSWKEYRQKFKLDSSAEIVFDESYQPEGEN